MYNWFKGGTHIQIQIGFKIIMNKRKQKIKHKRKREGELNWASDLTFGLPGKPTSTAHSSPVRL
jgi:hypothetical protein